MNILKTISIAGAILLSSTLAQAYPHHMRPNPWTCRQALAPYYPDNGNGYFNTQTGQCQTPEALNGCPGGSEWSRIRGLNFLRCITAPPPPQIQPSPTTCAAVLSPYYPDNGQGYYNYKTGYCQTPQALNGCPQGSEMVNINGLMTLRCLGQ